MKTLEIHVPEDTATKIEMAAEEQGISVDELVRASVEEKLARDASLTAATKYVLAKNADLYERLS